MMIPRLSIFVCTLLTVNALSAFGADVIKFKPLGAAYQDNNNIPLRSPEGIACGKNMLIAADTGNGRLVRFDIINDGLQNGVEIKVEQLSQPVRIKSSTKGDLLVLDGKSRKIAKISSSGSFQGYVDPQKVQAPEDFVLRSMAVDSKDSIYLVDILGERVLVLDAAGVSQRQIPFPKGYGYIMDVTVDGSGNVFIVDSMKSQVFKAAPAEQNFTVITKDLDDYLYFAVSIETDAQGRIYLLDQNDNGVVVLNRDGKFFGRYLSTGWKVGQIYYPGQGCLSENGYYAIADRNNNRIQLFKTQ